MRPDTTPTARVTVVLAALSGLAVAGWIVTATPSTVQSGGYTNSIAGPVGQQDRAMLVAVRQATLWEEPAVQQAQLATADPRVRQMSQEILGGLNVLTEQVQTVASRLQVALPNQPTAEQQMWANDMSEERGTDYDREMIGYLYRSCTDTMTAVNNARDATENSDIRSLAQLATEVIRDHLRQLNQLRR